MKEQIHQMFYQWKRREGNGATSDKLLSAMKSAGGFDEQIKILTGKGMIENEKSKSKFVMLMQAVATEYNIHTCTIFTVLLVTFIQVQQILPVHWLPVYDCPFKPATTLRYKPTVL